VLPALGRLEFLQKLTISHCPVLKSLPEELQHLISLRELNIRGCSILGPRCQKEVGEYWSIISHIPNIYIDKVKIHNDISEFHYEKIIKYWAIMTSGSWQYFGNFKVWLAPDMKKRELLGTFY
ncbi:hypothetical protein GIB67_021822, partial [Kingdonia uniflora]